MDTGDCLFDGPLCDAGEVFMNQTAAEIAREYEALAIKSANQHYHLKQQKPFSDFPALAAHVSFCSTMQVVWNEIAQKLEAGPSSNSANDDMNDRWGLCD